MSGIDTTKVPSLTKNTLWESEKRTSNVTYRSALRSAQTQGRRRVFQSGPTEEAIECHRHERVASMRGVSFHHIVRGSPPRFFFNFERFYVRF